MYYRLRMNNDIDFSKIIDSKGNLLGVLNFNNMIPIRKDVIKKIDLRIHLGDNPDIVRRKLLMANQLTICRQQSEAICKKANKLYRIIYSSKVSIKLKR